jgi:RNA polymerase sigma factor (sigma-70 family)
VHERLAELLPSAFRFAYQLTSDRHRAEDLAQEALLRACRSSNPISEVDELRVWLFRVIKNLWIDDFRARKNETSSPVLVEQLRANTMSVELQLEQNELLTLAMHRMQQLPERQRTVLHLVACEGMSLREVSQILGISIEAAKASLCVARSSMREFIAPMSAWEERKQQ